MAGIQLALLLLLWAAADASVISGVRNGAPDPNRGHMVWDAPGERIASTLDLCRGACFPPIICILTKRHCVSQNMTRGFQPLPILVVGVRRTVTSPVISIRYLHDLCCLCFELNPKAPMNSSLGDILYAP